MKITDRLAGDHKTFRKLVRDIDTVTEQPPPARDRARLAHLARLLLDHLRVHAWFEDTFYYPAVRAVLADAPAPAAVDHAFLAHLEHEHKTLDGYAVRLDAETAAAAPPPAWPQTFALLMSGLENHMRREEETLFPFSEERLGTDALERLADEMERRRNEAPAPLPRTRP
jgi:iron-sulfur cluster repair protein YtfE (RIC family)